MVEDPREKRERELKEARVAKAAAMNASLQRQRLKRGSVSAVNVVQKPAGSSLTPAAGHPQKLLHAASMPVVPRQPVLCKAKSDDAASRRPHGFVDRQKLKAENEALRVEVERLREANAKAGGELLVNDAAKVMAEYRRALAAVLSMRADGQFVQPTVDEYYRATVQLSEEDYVRSYQALMKVYVGEADADSLAHLGIANADGEEVIQFAESVSLRLSLSSVEAVDPSPAPRSPQACIKMGELLGIARRVRIQKHEQELEQRKELEVERRQKEEKERQLMASQSALRAAGRRVFEALTPLWLELTDILAESRGDLDEAEVKRFKWRNELQLLVMPPSEMKRLSPYQWQTMSLGGLRDEEKFGLISRLSDVSGRRADVPGQADRFISSLRHALGSEPPTSVALERMCTPPAWFTICVGCRVVTELGAEGVVQFKGAVRRKPGLWIGIALDLPQGKNDGSAGNVRYFSCAPKHGIFARAEKLRMLPQQSQATVGTELDADDDGVADSLSLPTQAHTGVDAQALAIHGL